MKIAKEISIILGITWIGEMLNQILPLPIPAGVYGLFLLLALLCFGMVKPEDVDGTGKFLLDNMSPMFIPAGGGLPYLLINLVSTVIVFVVTGKITQLVMEKTGKEGK